MGSIAGRVRIDTRRGIATCERCNAVHESRELAELLKFASAHHLCPGASLPIVVAAPTKGAP